MSSDRLPPDDRELDAFMDGRHPVSTAWREARESQRAPDDLDAAILQAARSATRRPRRPRWLPPLAAAATLGLAATVLLQLRHQPGVVPVPADAEPTPVVAGVAPQPRTQAEPEAEAGAEPSVPVAKREASPAAELAESAPAEALSSPSAPRASIAAPPAAPPTAAAGASIADPAEGKTTLRSGDAPASAAPAPSPAPSASEPLAPAAEVPAAEAPAAGAAKAEDTATADVAGQRREASSMRRQRLLMAPVFEAPPGDAARTPEDWFAAMRVRRQAGDDAALRELLRQFRVQYPELTLPDDLRDLEPAAPAR